MARSGLKLSMAASNSIYTTGPYKTTRHVTSPTNLSTILLLPQTQNNISGWRITPCALLHPLAHVSSHPSNKYLPVSSSTLPFTTTRSRPRNNRFSSFSSFSSSSSSTTTSSEDNVGFSGSDPDHDPSPGPVIVDDMKSEDNNKVVKDDWYYNQPPPTKTTTTLPSMQQQQSSAKLLTLPTILTLGRVAAVPLLIGTFYVDSWWGRTATTSIFIAAAITDWLDGYIARKMRLGSAFGAFLDPVADKLMVAATLVLLCTKPLEISAVGQVPWLLTVPAIAIIGREITMSAVREWAASQNAKLLEAVAVNNLGKWKTASQMIALTILLATRDGSIGGPGILVGSGVGLLYMSAGLSLWSLAVYMGKIWKVLLNRVLQIKCVALSSETVLEYAGLSKPWLDLRGNLENAEFSRKCENQG
ncbi:hypothetical protein LWI29_020464 [Acer saccharum]|uniref:CDP-diacylglycerol--glycerol-3-phosphate 1-phosphatidyltransferase n=1 Tax=Acer saccharum TaxID=4024 RepID=A0AA39SGQ7_ACESA|nr:hypothetical protein LWI29_020464 [Acer saccharum]